MRLLYLTVVLVVLYVRGSSRPRGKLELSYWTKPHVTGTHIADILFLKKDCGGKDAIYGTLLIKMGHCPSRTRDPVCVRKQSSTFALAACEGQIENSGAFCASEIWQFCTRNSDLTNLGRGQLSCMIRTMKSSTSLQELTQYLKIGVRAQSAGVFP